MSVFDYPLRPSVSAAPAQTVSAAQQAQAQNPYASTDLNALMQQISGMLSIPTVSYTMPSRSELEADIAAYLRPRVDQSISRRKNQTLANRAEIDVDAASRGMGRSSWVTDVKDRAMDAESTDVSAMESDYMAELLSQVEALMMQHQQNAFVADQINATNQMSANAAALNAALGLYGSNLDYERQQAQNKTSGRGGSSSAANATMDALMGGSSMDWDALFSGLTYDQRVEALAKTRGAANSGMTTNQNSLAPLMSEDEYKKMLNRYYTGAHAK